LPWRSVEGAGVVVTQAAGFAPLPTAQHVT
jgi:hypothetical protein